MKLGVIVIGYNRKDSIKRLLSCLSACDYGKDSPVLIISIDKSDTKEVEEYANDFLWKFGEKIVKTFPERLGLKQHIFKCGSYMEEYGLDAVAVFEDDIVPSVDFYNYMKQSVLYYGEDEKVAGLALYSYNWNPVANKPFSPAVGNSDVYLSQFAVSWGQIWLRAQWKDFVQWYEQTDESAVQGAEIPDCVKAWDKSWLKYHIAYCSIMKKYFVYPYRSLSTCFSEPGEHTENSYNHLQVPVVEVPGKTYQFTKVQDIKIRYDSFFESELLKRTLQQRGYETCVDLYGLKGMQKGQRYWLTLEDAPYKIQKSYGLRLKPHEQNILNEIEGSEIRLYDIQQLSNEKNSRKFCYNKFMYYFNGSIDKRFWGFHVKRVFKIKLKAFRKK